jgi:hypothetical protein
MYCWSTPSKSLPNEVFEGSLLIQNKKVIKRHFNFRPEKDVTETKAWSNSGDVKWEVKESAIWRQLGREKEMAGAPVTVLRPLRGVRKQAFFSKSVLIVLRCWCGSVSACNKARVC